MSATGAPIGRTPTRKVEALDTHGAKMMHLRSQKARWLLASGARSAKGRYRMRLTRRALAWARPFCAMLLSIVIALSPCGVPCANAADAEALASVIAEHKAAIAAHGHAHDVGDLTSHAFSDHWSDIMDSDHGWAWLPPHPPAMPTPPSGDRHDIHPALAHDGAAPPQLRPPRA